MTPANPAHLLGVREAARVFADARPHNWRFGQAVFNGLASLFPAEVESLRGGPLDPFHDDSRVAAFLDEVERRRNENAR